MLFYSVPNSVSNFEHVLIHFELYISLVKEVLVLSVKSVRQMWNNLENHRHVNIAILLLRSLATSVNGAPTQRRNMDLQWHVNSANRNVPLIERMKIKRYIYYCHCSNLIIMVIRRRQCCYFIKYNIHLTSWF